MRRRLIFLICDSLIREEATKKILSIAVSIIIIAFAVSGCELVVLGSARKKSIPMNQKSGVGAAYLFKNQLDSSNVFGAARILSAPNRLYLAVELSDLYYEVERISRTAAKKEITDFKADTVSPKDVNITMRLNYVSELSLKTRLIKKYWRIIDCKTRKSYWRNSETKE